MFEQSDLIFDYIIIGTGPSGAVMAKTLSDNPNISVLVLEAGDNNTNELPIQTISNETWRYFPRYFWQGRTVLQQHVNNKLFNWTTGRTLGGGSSVNGGQYVRPSIYTMNAWEESFGPLWSFSNAVNSFVNLENYYGETSSPLARGYNGPIDVSQIPEHIPALTQKLTNALSIGTGYPIILDYNDPNTPVGAFYQWQLYQQPDGNRESSATAFLSSEVMTPDGYGVNGRQLRVLMEATALRILFDENKVAIGVTFLLDGYCYVAYASIKVIISANINSSQLLMLSGIGPTELLEFVGVPTLVNSPRVGDNLANHLINTVTFSVNDSDLNEFLVDPNPLYAGGAFVPTPFTEEDRDVQLIGEIINGFLTLYVIYLNPKSKGSIQAQNNDPLKIVLADYNFLSSQLDMDMIKDIFRTYVVKIAAALSAIDPSYQLVSPSIETINNDTLLENFIRSNSSQSYHEQSFNIMADSIEEGVVNSKGEVFGVKNLIVADCSIVPYTIDGNNSATAYLIGYNIAKTLLPQ
ncbi:MAG: dehydrogenase [Anaerocolumna sp.]|jgi:choline dehydrogenase|nr:dehydrogenase [Anaerocolumna sp.]